MMLGCCHCGNEPPSESSQSGSGSTGSDGVETVITSCSPLRCLNNEIPLRYSFSVEEPPGTTGACKAFYYGAFTVFYQSPTCHSWASAELAKVNIGCADVSGQARWTIGISTSGGATSRIALGAFLDTGGFVTRIALFDLIFTRESNCVRSFVLSKVDPDSLGYKWPATVEVFTA